MPPVAVLTDSTASIPEKMLADLNIQTVAYYIHRGQEVLHDLVTIQRQEFLEWLATARVLPTTASPGPGDYLEAYRGLIRQGAEEIISIHMTSEGSGAYQAASVAQSMLKDEQQILPPLQDIFAKNPIEFTINHPPRLARTTLGDEVGLLGALALGKYKLENNPVIATFK